jgi:hypothetical protein
MPQVKLIDGAVVDSDSHEWMRECLARSRHITALWHLHPDSREAYLAGVHRREGLIAADRVRARFQIELDRIKSVAKKANPDDPF